MICCIPDPRRGFLSTEGNVFAKVSAMVLMNCKFSSLSFDTIAETFHNGPRPVIGAVCRTFFVIVIFESTRECLQAGARGRRLLKIKNI